MKQLKRKLRQSLAGFLAFCLTMTSFNMVSWADVEKAFDSGNAIFMISGEELRNSAQAAIDAGETFQVDDLGLGDKDQSLKREYEKLFGKGHVYEFSPGYYMDEEASADGAELRMFIRTADTDGEYLLTGDEEVIFLYVNESDEKITFRSNIDGYLTQKVSVKAFSEGTTAIPNVPEVQPELPVPDEGVVNPEETEAEEESKAVDETEDAEEVESTEETGSTEETEENGNVEESSEAEEGAEDAEEGSGTESGSDETADDEGQADSEESSDDADTGSEDSDAGSSDDSGSEAEETDNGSSDEGSGAQASISRHVLSVLTSSDVTALQEGTPSEAEPEVEDEPVVEEGEGSVVLGTTNGKTYGAILLDESYYAKAYVTTLNQLNVDTTAEGYRVTYSVEPLGTAYAEGPKAVEENGTLSFKVTPQVGYEISSVTINGETAATDETGDGRTLSYTVTEVTEEQEVAIVTTATSEHPEFSASIPMEDGTVIHIYAAEGILPAGVKAVANVVPEIESVLKDKVEAEDGGQVASVLAYDINLILDGEKLDNTWSDNGYVTVTFSGSRIKKETAEGSSVEIYAVDDTSAEELNVDTAATATADVLTLESIRETLDVSGDSGISNVSFEAEHFTIYAIIIGGENTPVATYNFYNGGTDPVNTQKVKNNEILVEPKIPVSSESNKFLGWSTNAEPKNYQTFGAVEVTADKEIDLYARFEKVYHVIFYNQYDAIKEIKEALPGNLISADDVEIDVLSNEALTGWTLKKGSSNKVNFPVTVIDGNIELYPVIEAVKWITYNANGGTYTKPAYVAAGEKATEPIDPSRAGYTFAGWYRNPNLSGQPFAFDNFLDTDILLYAKWTPWNNINYTVIHWKQNANDDGYSFWKSETLKGMAGATTAAKHQSEGGFTPKSISQGTIAGDSSTIVNVYYDRKVYTVRFYYKKNIFSWSEYENLRITAKFEADIKDKWPKDNPVWATSKDGSKNQTGIEVMPEDGAKFYSFDSSGKYTFNLNYYLEVLDGTDGTVNNGRKYKLDHTDTYKANTVWQTNDDDRYPIKGFTYSQNITGTKNHDYVGDNVYKADFYYYRNDYNINFFNGGNKHTISKQYQEDISNVEYTPKRPEGIPSGYDFAGWYDNSLFAGIPYSFAGKTMPAMNITLYGKWAAPQFDVTFDLNNGSGDGDYSKQTVNYGNTATQPTNPTKYGFTFAGWLHDEKLFNFNTEIHKDTKLVARWISNHTLSVVYDAGEGNGEVPEDNNQYIDKSSAVALSATDLTHSTKYFIGWQLGSKVYYPGDTFVVDSSLVEANSNQVKLVAIWSELPASAVLTYHSNFGTDDTSRESFNNNSTITIAEGSLFTRDGYLFRKWTTESDGTGEEYQPGDTVLLDNNNGRNVLYAQWVQREALTITAASDTFLYDGDEHSLQNAEVTSGSLATGDDLVYTVEGSVRNVTDTVEGNNELKSWKIMRGGKDVTDEYNITIVHGTLTVITKPVTITVANRSKVYGAADPIFANATMTGAVGNELDEINLTVKRSNDTVEKVGTYPGVLIIEAEEADLNAAYKNYSFTVTLGNFAITANQSMTVTAPNVEKVYDGIEYGVTPVSSPAGAVITYKNEEGVYTSERPTLKDVGTKTVEFKAMLEGYEEKTGSATITITSRPVSITVDSKVKNYGRSDADLVFTGTINGLINDGDLGTVTYDRMASDIGKENVGDDIKLTAYYTLNDNYSVTVLNGKLDIVASNENAVVVTGRQATYDGTAYSLTEAYAAREGSSLQYSTDNVEFTDEAPLFTEAGVYVVYVRATNPNYEPVTGEGKVVINKRNITVTASSASKTYDGTPLTYNSAIVTSGSIVDGQTWTVKVIGSQTAVGTSKNIASGIVIKEEERDVTANYNISYISGDLTVTSAGGGNNSGGGGGGGSTPNPNSPYVPGGPGTVTINPDQIPLANLPGGNPADELILIEDNQIPLAGLPKTGDRNVIPNLAAIISGVLLAAYAMITGKKKEEN